MKKIKEKKPITLKNLIIRRILFIILFLLISFGITIYLIINNSDKSNNKTLLDNEISKKPNRNHISVIDYEHDTFDYNELKITEISEKYKNYDITYFQIDGLINTTIQEKINNNLKNDLENSIDKAINDGNIKGDFYVWANQASNFANTISISYSLMSNIIDDKTYEEVYSWEDFVTENYDLNTGNKIQIQDIFTNDTMGLDIFNKSFYKEFVSSYTEQEFNEDMGEYKIIDYKDIEEEILDLVTNFNNGKDIPFYFDEQSITLLKNYANIYYDENLEFVEIYNKFKSEKSLFTGEYDSLKNLPVLTKRYPSYYQVIEEGENYYIDVSLDGPYDERLDPDFKRLLKCAEIRVNEDIENMKKEAKKSGKFIIFNYAYSFGKYTEWDFSYNDCIEDGTYVLSCNKAKFITTKSLFKNELKDKIKNAFRVSPRFESGEIRLYNNQFYLYMYEDDYDYENIEKDWNIITDEDLYMDKVGNIFETHEEALNSIIWGTED